MQHYEGIEEVDQRERERQRILTQALWRELTTQGAGPGTEGRIECFLYATAKPAVAAMAAYYRSLNTRKVIDDESPEAWAVMVDESTEAERIQLRITTPLVRYSLDAFLGLIDVMMIDALRFGLAFDGFNVNVAATSRPSWLRRLLRSLGL